MAAFYDVCRRGTSSIQSIASAIWETCGLIDITWNNKA